MSIIENAANAGAGGNRRRSMDRLRARQQSPNRQPSAPVGPPKRSKKDGGSSMGEAVSEQFTLDEDLMAQQGFYTPSHKPKRLALELRAIKRRLMRRLDFSRHGTTRLAPGERQHNTVLLTSTRPAEGKTFAAINLALSLAIEDGVNVLLVDADVPRPKVFGHFGLTAGAGLTDLINDPDLDISKMIVKEKSAPLALLSQGTAEQSPNELFSRQEMADFIRELSLRYPDRIIIFDAPPVLATPEAVTIARYVDEVAFVVEANGTPEPAVATALEEVLDVNSHVSLILNRCLVPERISEYGSYEEYYYKDYEQEKKKAKAVRAANFSPEEGQTE